MKTELDKYKMHSERVKELTGVEADLYVFTKGQIEEYTQHPTLSESKVMEVLEKNQTEERFNNDGGVHYSTINGVFQYSYSKVAQAISALSTVDIAQVGGNIKSIKLEWQKHNRDNGLTWNEVAELVNQVAAVDIAQVGEDIICPFCHEDNFDKEGLKHHLFNYCEVHANTENI